MVKTRFLTLIIYLTTISLFGQSSESFNVVQISDNEIISAVDNQVHFNYGLVYPLTYQISIPAGSSNLKAFAKVAKNAEWNEVIEKTTSDFFSGIDAVRFDYDRSLAFLSKTFAFNSDSIYIKIINEFGDLEEISFEGITKYYDNRDAVVTSTADDWADYCDEKFVQSCREFRKRKLWLSTAIITRWSNSVTFRHIQNQLDSGYVEAIAHSSNHSHTPYDDYELEIAGCKEDIINKLRLPQQFKIQNKEYVYIWIAPFGDYDETVDSIAAANKYLASRLYEMDYHTLSDWDDSQGFFDPMGASLEIGPTEIFGDPWPGTDDINVLNSTFDSVTNEGGVYHAMIHPNTDVYLEDYFHQHLDYISERKNIWYAATGHLYLYNYMRQLLEMPVHVADNTRLTPTETVLNQNYPNPFNPATTITFSLAKKERVKLKIFNLLGQLLATLTNNLLSPGVYEYNWDASNYGSGMYLYVLEGESINLSRKMVLVK